MKIDFTETQLTLLKEIIHEYAEGCYHSMFDYQHAAVDADDDYIKKEYSAMAQSEEARFNESNALLDFIKKYEELMGGQK